MPPGFPVAGGEQASDQEAGKGYWGLEIGYWESPHLVLSIMSNVPISNVRDEVTG
jgi:hypothetical protein